MPVADDFNAETSPAPKNYVLKAINDHMLQATSQNESGYRYATYSFDFLNRVVVMVPASGDNRTFLFSEFDQGSIEWHYNKLREMGMKPRPPEHLSEKPVAPRRASGLNA